ALAVGVQPLADARVGHALAIPRPIAVEAVVAKRRDDVAVGRLGVQERHVDQPKQRRAPLLARRLAPRRLDVLAAIVQEHFDERSLVHDGFAYLPAEPSSAAPPMVRSARMSSSLK